MNDKLISRDALLKEFNSLCGPQTGDGWDNMGVRNLIKRQPIVDAVPVVHGRWECREAGDENTLRICSVCGDWQIHYRKYLPKYCPNCGAKMDGEQEDG